MSNSELRKADWELRLYVILGTFHYIFLQTFFALEY